MDVLVDGSNRKFAYRCLRRVWWCSSETLPIWTLYVYRDRVVVGRVVVVAVVLTDADAVQSTFNELKQP